MSALEGYKGCQKGYNAIMCNMRIIKEKGLIKIQSMKGRCKNVSVCEA